MTWASASLRWLWQELLTGGLGRLEVRVVGVEVAPGVAVIEKPTGHRSIEGQESR